MTMLLSKTYVRDICEKSSPFGYLWAMRERREKLVATNLKSEEKPAPYIKVDWNKWCDEDEDLLIKIVKAAMTMDFSVSLNNLNLLTCNHKDREKYSTIKQVISEEAIQGKWTWDIIILHLLLLFTKQNLYNWFVWHSLVLTRRRIAGKETLMVILTNPSVGSSTHQSRFLISPQCTLTNSPPTFTF
ncbi:hypothetical protein YC2023_068794 [Brassica napus]